MSGGATSGGGRKPLQRQASIYQRPHITKQSAVRATSPPTHPPHAGAANSSQEVVTSSLDDESDSGRDRDNTLRYTW